MAFVEDVLVTTNQMGFCIMTLKSM